MRNPVVRGNVALVTGGASGIGQGIAQALLEAGLDVVIGDVRQGHLEEARKVLAWAGERVHLRRLDVTNRGDWAAAADHIARTLGDLHILCLNAGIGVLGSMIPAGDADWDWLTNVNLGGVVLGVETFLDDMIRHGNPAHVMATSSMGGLVVANDGGIYSAGKFAVVAYMETVRRTLEGTRVGASVLCPAAVNTNIFDHERMRPSTHDRPTAMDDAALIASEAFARTILAQGRQPIEVGRMVTDAIARNDAYLFTDSNVRPTLLARRDALLSFAAEPA
jgi:NADP-dependent 3-hydroxy acid dehydrogenase YdfG